MLGLHPEVKKRAKQEGRFTIQFKLDGRNVPTKDIHGKDSFHCCYEFAGDLSPEQGQEFLDMYIEWLKRAEEERKAKRQAKRYPHRERPYCPAPR